jgi:hypothetical protein
MNANNVHPHGHKFISKTTKPIWMNFIYECLEENNGRLFTGKFIKKYVIIWGGVKSLISLRLLHEFPGLAPSIILTIFNV